MAISEDIGKPLSRGLEPRETKPRDDCRNQCVNTQQGEVRLLTPIQHIPRLLHDGCQGVEIQPLPEFFGQMGDGVEDRGHEHQHGDKRADELRDIAQENSKRRQPPAEAENEQQERQDDQWQIKRCGVGQAKKDQMRQQPDAKADSPVE